MALYVLHVKPSIDINSEMIKIYLIFQYFDEEVRITVNDLLYSNIKNNELTEKFFYQSISNFLKILKQLLYNNGLLYNTGTFQIMQDGVIIPSELFSFTIDDQCAYKATIQIEKLIKLLDLETFINCLFNELNTGEKYNYIFDNIYININDTSKKYPIIVKK